MTQSLARNDSAPRWERRDTWVPPYGVRRSSRADRVVRPYNGTSRTPSPTHSVIARSEATRQSVLPSPKRRIPTPVCTPRALASRRALARNDSAARWERRDTWVPPYGVRRSFRADRGVRPYKAEQEPRKTGRRGRRPLRNHKGCVQRGGRRHPSPTGSVRTRKSRSGGSGSLFYRYCSNAAVTKPWNRGWGRSGRLLNSGWN